MTSYTVSALILILLSYVYIRIADRFNIIDKPNHRSSHKNITVRGGGVLFFFALLLFFINSNFQYPFLILGVSLIAIVSFIDDIISLDSKIRLLFQIIALILMLIQLFSPVDDWGLIILFVTVGVGFVNIYNFMDGINGITGLYSLSVFSLYYFINAVEHIIQQDIVVFSIISLLIFGFYNFRRKAKLFAGDVGSISIAMIIFFIGLKMTVQLEAPILLLCFMLYGADALITILYRKYLGEKLTEAHRHHIYQKLVDVLKWSHMKVSIIYTTIQLMLNVVVFFTYKVNLFIQWVVYTILVILFIGIYIFIFKKIEAYEGLKTENLI